MKLFFTPFSPFARKCRVVAMEKGLENRIELLNTPPADNPPALLTANPLGMVPALVLDDGTYLSESPVICEYLDSLAATPVLYPKDATRFKVLGQAALADGILAAAVTCVLEGRRPQGERSAGWIQRKENAVKRTIEVIAQNIPEINRLDIATINIAIALNYVGFRLAHLEWQKAHPALAKWYESVSKRPSLSSTAPEKV